MFDDIRLRPLCANEPQRCFVCGRDAFECRCPTPGWAETIPQRNARLNLTNWRPRAEEAK